MRGVMLRALHLHGSEKYSYHLLRCALPVANTPSVSYAPFCDCCALYRFGSADSSPHRFRIPFLCCNDSWQRLLNPVPDPQQREDGRLIPRPGNECCIVSLLGESSPPGSGTLHTVLVLLLVRCLSLSRIVLPESFPRVGIRMIAIASRISAAPVGGAVSGWLRPRRRLAYVWRARRSGYQLPHGSEQAKAWG